MPKKTKREKKAIEQHKSRNITLPPIRSESFEDATNRVIELPPTLIKRPSVFVSKKTIQMSDTSLFMKDMRKSIGLTIFILCIECALFGAQNMYHDILSKLLSIITL